jgi:enoyl-CoA hydratase
MVHECFDVAIDAKVARVTLKRADALNTMIPAFWRELPQIVHGLDAPGDVRAIVLASTGRHFTAGMDLSVFQSMPDAAEHEAGRARAALMRTVQALQESFNCLEAARVPVLAAVQGGCIGGGVDMVAACDMRYCTRDAFFCIQEINLGIVADLGTYPRLAHLMPHGLLRELAYTGRKLDAEAALRAGLVNAVYDTHEALLEAVTATAHEIAARSPLAVWGSKEMLNYGRDHSIADGLRHIATWQAGMFQQADLEAALAARMRKDEPRFEDLLPLDKAML